jgi:pyruvate ferredoxin oxidoreductase delta subunit
MSLKTWKEVPIGGMILEAGNAKTYNTGSWRSMRPVRNAEKCTNCHICWIYCPDSSIIVKDGKMEEFDLDHCKGCGICAEECPVKCIEMKDEGEFR